MLRIKNPGRLDTMLVLVHTLNFGADGWANGDELTEAERERLRRFHFTILDVPDKADEDAEDTLFDVPDSASPKPARAKSATNRKKAGER